jgi:TolB-like protein/DNA-binding winged helix-turn-helix (wHTH) protein/Tfp pilus assembly protein PilF
LQLSDLLHHSKQRAAILLAALGVYFAYSFAFMARPSDALRAKFGDFVADFNSFELRKHGLRQKLQDQPFQILRLLLQRPGQLVTREELRLELWKESTFVDFDAGLNAAIRRLRSVLNDSADEPRYIETLPRHGYRFIAPVEIVTEPVLEPRGKIRVPSTDGSSQQKIAASAEPVGVPASNQVPRGAIWLRRLAAACVLLAAFFVSTVALRSRVLATHSSDGRTYSIAVLPLQNLSGDPSQEYFADGMTDALITDLAQSKSLQVISSTSSTRYKGVHEPLRQIARELNVNVIVEGSVIRSGNHVRVSAQLVDAAKDRHIWARSYDRDLRDVLRLQGELASTIALEVAGRLAPDERVRLTSQTRLVNPQAYEAYLKGEYFLYRWTDDGFERAKGYFQQAIDIDPSWAEGYAGLAEYYGTVAFMGTVPPRESWIKAEEVLAKALELDETSSNAHTLLGMIKLQFRCDPVASEKELNRALELNPGNMRALDYHSYYLLEIGRTDQAIAEKQQVLEHDPVSVITNAELGLYFLHAARLDEAITQLQKAIELDPNYAAARMRLGFAYEQKQRYPEALAEFEKAMLLDQKPTRLAHLGMLYAHWGKRKEALQTIAELQAMSKQRYVAPTAVALIYARLGEKESAIAWLQKAKPDDDPKISDPDFDNLRSDSRFKALEGRLRPSETCPVL